MEPVDVIVVGAGLAGLRAAQVLNANGRSVLVLERAPVIGGRLASVTVDGYVLDEGFQLVNPAYPELVATGVGGDTDLRPFPAIVRYVDHDTERILTLADPRASWRDALGSREVSRLDLARFAGLSLRAAVEPVSAIRRRRDESTRAALARYGLSTGFVEEIVRPFLRGALLDDELETSWRYTQLLLRSFVRGRPGTYPTGVAALPAALAARLGDTTFRLGEAATAIDATSVTTSRETYRARRVIVATDASSARELVGAPPVRWRAQTTWWLATPRLEDGAVLRLVRGAGQLASALDVSAVAPERARPGHSLVAAAATGVAEDTSDTSVRETIARLYGLSVADVEVVATSAVSRALVEAPAPLSLSRPSVWGDVVLAGDYLQTPSIQGALVSGRRAAEAVLHRAVIGSVSRD